jgi:hypothetical protein
MQIKILNYRALSSPLVMAFVDIELDGWLRFIGLNLMRDGSLRAAQLKTRSGSREGWLYFPAIVIPDDDLRELLISEILAAIRAHVASLPPEKRMRPPRPPAVPPVPATTTGIRGVAFGTGAAPRQDHSMKPRRGNPQLAAIAANSEKAPEKSPNGKKVLPPPRRLLTGAN